MAVLRLKPHTSLDKHDGVTLSLRYLGYGAVADAALNEPDSDGTRSRRRSQQLFEAVSRDPVAFAAAPATEDLHALPRAHAFVQGDPRYFLSRKPAVNDAEDAARARRPEAPSAALATEPRTVPGAGLPVARLRDSCS